MASSVRVSVPQGVATQIFTGIGTKILLQAGQVYIGGSNVSTANGLFLSGFYSDYYDLGVVLLGETLYALSPDFDNEVTVLSISAT